MDGDEPGSHMRRMSERRGNIFRFRRLKWGAPKRLDGLKAIGLEDARAPAPEVSSGGIGAGTIGLVVVAMAAGAAIGFSLLGWF